MTVEKITTQLLPSLSPQDQKKLAHPRKKRWKAFRKLVRLLVQIIGAIAIPVAIALFSTQQHQTDLQIATDQQQETVLQKYLDSMSELLLNKNLGTSKPTDPVREVARARTLTALRTLDPARKGLLLRFLYESGLIVKKNPIVVLHGADLSYANLSGANLRGASLIEAFLWGADLHNADLSQADLRSTRLRGANLSYANLRGADLSNAQMLEANLSYADLRNAQLFRFTKLQPRHWIYANLSRANLSGANLGNANITNEQLAVVASLKGATLPNGSTHP